MLLRSLIIILLINGIQLEVFSKSIYPSIYIDESVDHIEKIYPQIQCSNSTLQLFSHGSPGHLFLDGEWKDSKKIVNWISKEFDLTTIDHINIYGCEFAKGETGKAALTFLEKELGISTAASDDGGDYDYVTFNTNTHYNIGNSTEVELLTPGLTWSKLSGNAAMNVTSRDITNSNEVTSDPEDLGPACPITGTGFTVSVGGDFTETSNGTAAADGGGGDGL